MEPKFEVLFLEQALKFLEGLDIKTRIKIYYSLDRAKLGLDPRLFKKLNHEIWEFRIPFNGNQYRFFAFWDRRNTSISLVIATHGIIKKTQKVLPTEIAKAESIRKAYFDQ